MELFDSLVTKKRRKPIKSDDEYFELHRYNETKRFLPKRTFHFAFVGDSRIRQLFALLYQVITVLC